MDDSLEPVTDIAALIREKREEILKLADHHHAFNVRVFGSVARGDIHSGSDIDFLVTFQPNATLWDMIGLWQDLTELLGCEVDLSSDASLKQWIKPQVLEEAIPL